MPGNNDIIIEQGIDFNLINTWSTIPISAASQSNFACCQNGKLPPGALPVDMTGMELEGTVYSGFWKEDYLITTFTCTVLSPPVSGQFSVYLPAISSSAIFIDPDENDRQKPYMPLGFYDISVVNGPRILEGEVTIRKAGPTTPFIPGNNLGFD